MDDYSELLPYLIKNIGDFSVFNKYLNIEIDYSKSSFNLHRSKIKSWEEVGNVRTIGGNLDLTYSQITTLGKLESVGGHLYLIKAQKLKDLGNLKEVKGNIFYERDSKVEELLKERGLI